MRRHGVADWPIASFAATQRYVGHQGQADLGRRMVTILHSKSALLWCSAL